MAVGNIGSSSLILADLCIADEFIRAPAAASSDRLIVSSANPNSNGRPTVRADTAHSSHTMTTFV